MFIKWASQMPEHILPIDLEAILEQNTFHTFFSWWNNWFPCWNVTGKFSMLFRSKRPAMDLQKKKENEIERGWKRNHKIMIIIDRWWWLMMMMMKKIRISAKVKEKLLLIHKLNVIAWLQILIHIVFFPLRHCVAFSKGKTTTTATAKNYFLFYRFFPFGFLFFLFTNKTKQMVNHFILSQ